ncbi:hypothetical protein [Pseudoalteromonas sp. TB64]|uniref:hypothetical protein n=1 Tax=Pseudoalteromonas sp. TB64 TaxID=1938600 RepID=UPI0004041939|nr:hypothetical protein [Pseudoalteromonas sp. TB64]
MIRFTVIWFLTEGYQRESRSFQALTNLWLATVPIINASSTIFRLIRKKQSTFKPDQEYLRHIFMRFDFSARQALITMCIIAIVFTSPGIASELLYIPSYIIFWSFVTINIIYFFKMTHIWRITVKVRRYFSVTSKFNIKD